MGAQAPSPVTDERVDLELSPWPANTYLPPEPLEVVELSCGVVEPSTRETSRSSIDDRLSSGMVRSLDLTGQRIEVMETLGGAGAELQGPLEAEAGITVVLLNVDDTPMSKPNFHSVKGDARRPFPPPRSDLAGPPPAGRAATRSSGPPTAAPPGARSAPAPRPPSPTPA
jgi:hypothetical protein